MARQPLPKDTELRGRYRVDTVLGAGGFGITYVGLDLHLGRAVAIKEYFPADHAQREGHYTVRSLDTGTRQYFALGRSWFLREARTLAKYHHPNIVGVMDHFEENGTAYMILRFEEGQSLSRWLRTLGRPPTQFEVDGFMLPILSALEAMHTNNDMHRDVAMDNIILRPGGDPVLIDFGSARQAIGAHSRSIDAVVKFGYSPPEQYSVDSRLQGPWSDVYALASTLHLALTGKLPPDAPGRQLDDNYQPLATSNLQGYRIGLLEGIDWGLALKPAQRPQSISDWRRTLLKSSEDPLDEDPVMPIAHRSTPVSATVLTPGPTSLRNSDDITSGDGTIFVAQTEAVDRISRQNPSQRPSSKPSSGATSAAVRTAEQVRSRSASGQASRSAPTRNTPVTGAPDVDQKSTLRGRSRSRPPDGQASAALGIDASDGLSPVGPSSDSLLRSQSLEILFLVIAAVCGAIFFVVGESGGQVAGAVVVFTRLQAALVAGFGLALGGLSGRLLVLDEPLKARPRAMLALGLVWLPTVLLSVLAVPLLGLAAAMWRTQRPWHATALNVAGGLHILAGVLLIFSALTDSPMFVLATSMTLIGLGFLTLLTTRSNLDANT